jgi:hypothetical protein
MDTDEIARRANEAGFVFVGRAVTDREVEPVSVPATAGTGVVVRVEEVLRGTDVTRSLTGQDVTVATGAPDDVRRAGQLIFFTDVVSLGRRALVAERAHAERTDDAVREVSVAVAAAEEEPLASRAAQADLVVVGQVLASRPVAPDQLPTSEHDPDWWIARVSVGEVVKGRARRKELEVLFANSTDISWYRSPKLHEGVSGVFLLHSASDEDAPGPEAVPANVYRCTDPLDFQPAERLADVRRLTAAATETGEG